MELLTAQGIALYRRDQRVLDQVDLRIHSGDRIGLIGPNGSGKSSLLQVLAGKLPPTEGRLLRAPGVRSVLVAQDLQLPGRGLPELLRETHTHLRDLERQLRQEEARLAAGEDRLEAYGGLLEAFEQAGGYQAEATLRSLLAVFGFSEATLLGTTATLSGGEQRRLALALALAAQPELLFLDEPSNHLDLPTRATLARHLSTFHGGLVVASHDRSLLDTVCTHVAELTGAGIQIRRGNYQAFRRQRDQQRSRHIKLAKQHAREEARVRSTVAQLRQWGGSGVQQRRRRQQREAEQTGAAAARFLTTRARPLPPLASKSKPGPVLVASRISKRYHAKTVVDDATIRIEAGDRIALLGANGSGKTTLLRLLAGDLMSDDPQAEHTLADGTRTLLLDQRGRGLDDRASALTQLERWVSKERARQLLALVSVPHARWTAPVAELSGGQRARAGLAHLMASEAKLLLLDEPGNDLDLATIETLEEALIDSAATVVFATHDQRLVERVATRVFSLDAGELVEYRGGLRGYRHGIRRIEPEALSETVEAGGEPPSDRVPEDPLALLEDELEAVDEALTDPLRWSERQRDRLEQRRRDLVAELAARYDARLPPARPRFQVREQGLTIGADITESEDDRARLLAISSPAPLSATVRRIGEVGHLRMMADPGSYPLPWAQRAVAVGAARLGIYLLGITALQIQTDQNLEQTPFRAAGNGWWLLTRKHLEQVEGWGQDR